MTLQRAYYSWCDFFGAGIVWQSGIPQLPVNPRAGLDFNAYYDREGLKYFYNVDAATGETLYACQSSDIVAHECGHAILDALHPNLWDSLLAETIAFHEAFGDISAVLTTLADPGVRQGVLKETNGDLTRSNLVSRLAEQLARGLADSGSGDGVTSRESMRDLANTFAYANPDELPARASPTQLSSESHSFSRVFSGAFYDILVGIYVQLRTANPNGSEDTALAQARSSAGHLIGQAVTLAPKGDISFRTMASAMLIANAHNFGNRHFSVLRRVFTDRRILSMSEVDTFATLYPSENAVASSVSGTASASVGVPGMASGPLAIPVSTGDAAMAAGQFPSELRDRLQLPNHEYTFLGEHRRRDASRVLHYRAPREIRLEHPDFGLARGAVVCLADAISIHADCNGRVVSVLRHPAEERHENRIRDHICKLVERGRVYDTDLGVRPHTSYLIEHKQPYYIVYDRLGNKRIRRAYIA